MTPSSEWTGEDPTPTMSVAINLFSDFPKSPEFALLEGKLTALGGEDADGVSVNTMYEFNPATHGWTPGIYNMQSKRKSHSATVVPESWLCKGRLKIIIMYALINNDFLKLLVSCC